MHRTNRTDRMDGWRRKGRSHLRNDESLLSWRVKLMRATTRCHTMPTESRDTHHTIQNELGWLRLRIRPQLFVGANQASFAVNEWACDGADQQPRKSRNIRDRDNCSGLKIIRCGHGRTTRVDRRQAINQSSQALTGDPSCCCNNIRLLDD